jgi:hypothetical protein
MNRQGVISIFHVIVAIIVVIALVLAGLYAWYISDRTLTGEWPTGVGPSNADGYILINVELAKQASTVAPPLVIMDAGTNGEYHEGIPAANVQSFMDWLGALLAVNSDTGLFKVTVNATESTGAWSVFYTLYQGDFVGGSRVINGIPSLVWNWQSPQIFVQHGTVNVMVTAYEVVGGSLVERMTEMFPIVCGG